MSRRQQWSPYAVAGLRDNLVRTFETQVRDITRNLSLAAQHGLAESAVAHRDYVADALAAAQEAELFWVSSDMADVALDASHDMPGIIGQDVRWPVGMMLFEKPLPAQTLDSFPELLSEHGLSEAITKPVPIDGLLWFPVETGMRIEILAQTARVPEPLKHPRAALVTYTAAQMPLPADFTDDASFLDGAAPAPEPTSLGVAAFLAAAWHLMAMPAVARSRDVQPRTGNTRPAESVTVPPGQVRVVDARPMKSVPTDPDESGDEQGDGRRYSTRWVVRGHWRQQAHGPGRSQRRTQWIESYIKGPEDAPLAPHTLVRAWRR